MSEELEELRLLVARLSKDVLGVLAEREALRADRDRLAARVAALQAEVDACGDIIGQEHGATFGHAEIIEETIKEHQADNVKLAARVAELERERAPHYCANNHAPVRHWQSTDPEELACPVCSVRAELERDNAEFHKCVMRAEAAYCDLEAERDSLRAAAVELLEVADLRGDADLPKPDEDPNLWTARMQTAWDEMRAAIAPRAEGQP